MSHSTIKSEVLPPNFIFSPEDPFFYGPATCEFLHYRSATPQAPPLRMATIPPPKYNGSDLERLPSSRPASNSPPRSLPSLSLSVYLHKELKSLEFFVVLLLLVITVTSALTTLLMLYGLKFEKADFVRPKLALQQIQICLLLCLATVSIVAMCFGIEMTNNLFGVFLSVPEMERDFGPIWPFNISVLAFMSAALGVWMRIVSGGAYDYLLDKAFFATSGEHNIAMQSRHPKAH